MYFLGYLAACFLVVGAINLYLRHFGLPRRRAHGGDGKNTSTGYGSITFSGSGASVGGLLHRAAFTGGATGSGRGGGGGESVHWINSILAWICQTQNRVPDFVESWLNTLTTEAENQAKEMKICFEGIHGSPPEFSNFRTEATSAEKDFVILTTLTLSDVTLQASALGRSTATTKATHPVKCDVYIQSLTGQVKVVGQFVSNELCLQLLFVSEPSIKLQIRPARVDHNIDSVAFDKVVRAAICRATMRVDWTSRSAARPSLLRIVEPSSIERNHVQRSATDYQTPRQLSLATQRGGSTIHTTFNDNYSDSSPGEPPFVTPSPTMAHEGQLPLLQKPQLGDSQSYQSQRPQGQYPGLAHEQKYSPPVQTQLYQSQGQGQQYPGMIQGQSYPGSVQGSQYQETMQGQVPGIGQGQQQSFPSDELFPQGPKLFIKVVKANGLIDSDFGNCSAFCRVHIDNPPQDFATKVINSSVNPYWDESFISDFDRRTKQIQFEVLDRDRQPGNNLLGGAVVLVEEIRRMPSSRQIIPLTGKPKSRTSTSGSVTVEFIFKDSLESSPATSSGSATGTPFGIAQGPAGQKQSISSSVQIMPGAGDLLLLRDDKARAAAAGYPGDASRSLASPGASQLSAHNLALTSSQSVGTKPPQESPIVVVTGSNSQKQTTLKPGFGKLDASDTSDTKKKESFTNTLKRTLERVKIKPRSRSADRTSRSLREGNLLKPPGPAGTVQGTPSSGQQQPSRNADSSLDSAAGNGSDGALRKARSNSFSSSLRRIFRRDKRDSNQTKHSSSSSQQGRGGAGGGGGGSREALVAPDQDYDRSRRQNTPVPSGDRFAPGGGSDFPYSSSVPASSSPLQGR